MNKKYLSHIISVAGIFCSWPFIVHAQTSEWFFFFQHAFINDAIFATPLVLLILAIRYKSHRDLRMTMTDHRINSVQYGPPKGLTPAFAPLLNAAGFHDWGLGACATIVDLSVRKYISARQEGKQLILQRISKKASATEMLLGYEKKIINVLFQDGNEVVFPKHTDAFLSRCRGDGFPTTLLSAYNVYYVPKISLSEKSLEKMFKVILFLIPLSLFFGWVLFIAGMVMSAILVVIAIPYAGTLFFSQTKNTAGNREDDIKLVTGLFEEYLKFLKTTELETARELDPSKWTTGTAYLVATGLAGPWAHQFSMYNIAVD